MPMRAAVFDFDGVLVDSEPCHFRALGDALASEGVEITEKEYWEVYLAYDNRRALRLALEQHGEAADPDRIERMNARAAVRFQELVPEIPVFPGAEALVRALAREVRSRRGRTDGGSSMSRISTTIAALGFVLAAVALPGVAAGQA